MGHYNSHDFYLELLPNTPESVLSDLKAISEVSWGEGSKLQGLTVLVEHLRKGLFSFERDFTYLGLETWQAKTWEEFIDPLDALHKLASTVGNDSSSFPVYQTRTIELLPNGNRKVEFLSSSKHAEHGVYLGLLNYLKPYMALEDKQVVYRSIYEYSLFEKIFWYNASKSEFIFSVGHIYGTGVSDPDNDRTNPNFEFDLDAIEKNGLDYPTLTEEQAIPYVAKRSNPYPNNRVDWMADDKTNVSIWMEGFACTGQSGKAKLLGTYEAYGLKHAVMKHLEYNGGKIDLSYWHLKERMTGSVADYWGCKIYDNEAAARKTFG